jgi:hypothetical protein
VAKAVLAIPTTSSLIERLGVDKSLRRILGFRARLASSFRSHVFPGVRRIRARRAGAVLELGAVDEQALYEALRPPRPARGPPARAGR